MIALSFAQGTRTTTTIPLADPESGAAYVDANGIVETLTMRWPDHPSVAADRALLLATLEYVEAERLKHGESIAPDVAASLVRQRDASMIGYAVALVAGWSFAESCTPEAVRDLFARAPFVYALVIDAAGEDQRFLPDSLRTVVNESAPASVEAG